MHCVGFFSQKFSEVHQIIRIENNIRYFISWFENNNLPVFMFGHFSASQTCHQEPLIGDKYQLFSKKMFNVLIFVDQKYPKDTHKISI